MKLKYIIEVDKYICYATCLEDIAHCMNLKLPTLKYKLKNETLPHIQKIDTTLSEIRQKTNNSFSFNKSGIVCVPKTDNNIE